MKDFILVLAYFGFGFGFCILGITTSPDYSIEALDSFSSDDTTEVIENFRIYSGLIEGSFFKSLLTPEEEVKVHFDCIQVVKKTTNNLLTPNGDLVEELYLRFITTDRGESYKNNDSLSRIEISHEIKLCDLNL